MASARSKPMGDPAALSDKGWFRRFFEEIDGSSIPGRSRTAASPKVGLNMLQIPDEEDTLLKEIVEAQDRTLVGEN